MEVGEAERNASDCLKEKKGSARARLNKVMAKQRVKSNNNLLGRDFRIERFCDCASR